MYVKAGNRKFLVQEINADLSLAAEICSESNFDLKIKFDGKIVCVRFGVDKMWIVVGKREIYLVKPKTLSSEDLVELLRSILSLRTTTLH